MTRRAFLKAAGISAVGIMAAPHVSGSRRPPSHATADRPSAALDDPVGDLAASLGYDLERIHRFVADEIRYEPYDGILRGAKGTLRDRAGNSADQALLLGALLDASLLGHRFVHGALEPAHADAVLATTPVDPDTVREQTLVAMRGLMPTSLPEPPAVPPELEELQQRSQEILEAVASESAAQLERGVATITDALSAAGIVVPEVPIAMPTSERDRHVWVQVRQGHEWLDLDPALSGTQVGMRLGIAAQEPLGSLPDAFRHRMDFKLTVERVRGGELVEEPLVEFTGFADELAGLPITLYHEKPGALAELGVSIATSLVGGLQYMAILQVGDTAHIGLEPLVFEAGTGGFLEALDHPEAAADDGAVDGEAVSEWLEVTILAPDGRISTARRAIFDRVAHEARSAGPVKPSAISAIERVALSPEEPEEFLPLRTIHFMGVATGTTGADVFAAGDLSEDGPGALPFAAHTVHMGRDGLNAGVAIEHGVRTYLDGPNLVISRFDVAITPEGPRAKVTIDTLHRSFGQIPVIGRPNVAPPAIVSGVLSHVAERVALGEGLPKDLAPESELIGVGRVFDVAAARGIDLIVLRTGDDVSGLVDEPEAMGRLRASLAQGWVAIVPSRPVVLGGRDRIGWWLVDPTTGRTIDEMDDGTGSQMTEDLVTILQAMLARREYLRFGICLAYFAKEIATFVKLAIGNFWGFFYGVAIALLIHRIGHKYCFPH